jgi:RNA polymerase sigma-70 factor (ECF subfamily)
MWSALLHQKTMSERELEWAALMRSANRGNAAAYAELLTAVAPILRATARRGLARVNLERDVEDVVQETLLAIHLKRHTWDEARPFGPWVRAIAHHKIVDVTRRRGFRVEVPVDALADTLAAPAPDPDRFLGDAERDLGTLPRRQRDVVRAVTLEGATAREAGHKLKMSEGAVRVALHRGLAGLAARFGRRGSTE